jgi:4-hydroxythreonine-4-phosphate dehydrogenase
MGDPAGVGPELALRALADPELSKRYDLSVVGDGESLAFWSERLSLPVRGAVRDVEARHGAIDPGRRSPEGARASLLSIETAAGLCASGGAEAMVTAPVCKASIASSGTDFRGHTEFLAELTGSADYAMTFVHGNSRIALATTHIPLSRVPEALHVELILGKLTVLDAGLREWFAIDEPSIAVAALNPHAGEGGAFGDEEASVIKPAIEAARARGISARGPFPADSLFVDRGRSDGDASRGFDAALMMYHDQATIAAKLLGSGGSVNVTLGLPIVRTSVDHGTAFDLVMRGGVPRADSMMSAVRLAGEIADRVRAGRSSGTA